TLEGTVKLTDLGLARLYIEPNPELTIKGLCIGTPEFMAPEQAEDSSRADVRSDLYSLGSTLFHLLTGELAGRGNSSLPRLQQFRMVRAGPRAAARPEVPPGLAAVVDPLRARDPAERPGSAEEVVALLEPFVRQGRENAAPAWDGRRKA